MDKTPFEWENEYLRQLDYFEQMFQNNLEPWLQSGIFFAQLPYPEQASLSAYIFQQRNLLTQYGNTSAWFVARGLNRYNNKLVELKAHLDELIQDIMATQNMAPQVYPPFMPSPTPVYTPSPVTNNNNGVEEAKRLKIMQDLQADEQKHREEMYKIQQKITDSINRYNP